MQNDLDETGRCYFAALIYGLSLINEKEAEMGLAFGSIKADGDALAKFVAVKGDALVHHMNIESEKKITRSPHIRWLPNESRLVAEQCRRLTSGDVASLREEHLLRAQEVLPPDRRKDKFASSVLTYMRNFLRTGDGRKSSGARGKYHRRKQALAAGALAIPRNGRSAVIAPKPILSSTDSVTDLLANRIAETIIEVGVQALQLAAERLKTGSGAT